MLKADRPVSLAIARSRASVALTQERLCLSAEAIKRSLELLESVRIYPFSSRVERCRSFPAAPSGSAATFTRTKR